MRILIADDHELLRDMFVLYLDGQIGMEVETVADFGAAMDRLRCGPALDLVLLDVAMPGMNGLDGLKRMMALPDAPRVGLVSGTAPPAIAEQALAMGAAGFVPKSLSGQDFVDAVRQMGDGGQYAPRAFLRMADTAEPLRLTDKLSRREMQVLRGLTEGLSNKEIARDLDIREPTVKLHVKTLFRKLQATSRIQAAMIARDARLF